MGVIMTADFWSAVLAALLGSGIAGTLLGAILLKRTERITAEVHSHRAYQEAALEQLFGPAKMQLGRTKRAFKRWNKRNDHIEANIVRESNRKIRDLLLDKGHYLPGTLMDPAQQLIEHFDAWLEKFEELRVKNKDSGVDFVFVGPDGYPFPREAEDRIVSYAQQLQTELYGEAIVKG